MFTHNLGYPRIGSRRELKKACESYWAGHTTLEQLQQTARLLRQEIWQQQQDAAIDLIPCNDFSYYDHVLDLSLMVAAIPPRFQPLADNPECSETELYFAMARGYQKGGLDLTALEMTKWFDTNYHYLVPEFTRDQSFNLASRKIIDEYREASALGVNAKPVLIGPISYLLLGKVKQAGFHRLDLLERLLPVYMEILGELQELGAQYVQIDEPFLALDLPEQAKQTYLPSYTALTEACPNLKIILATYFDGLDDNTEIATGLPVHFLHLDLIRSSEQLNTVLDAIPSRLGLSLGVVDGRNVWRNDLAHSLSLIAETVNKLGVEQVALAPSCSLLHCPCDLRLEDDVPALPNNIRPWLAFARQKLDEVAVLKGLAQAETHARFSRFLVQNSLDMESRNQSPLIHKPAVKERLAAIQPDDLKRSSPFKIRWEKQHAALHLPLLPLTTIGSFPQTIDVRRLRLRLKKGEITEPQYEAQIREEIKQTIRWQEEVGLDVLVHGEFERNDMVEYFGERLGGFAFTSNGWVQSYGSRCVKPPIIFGDVERQAPMTVKWAQYAQSLTAKPVKGMLTGPITILQWSFARDDQSRSLTARQIALALRDEVRDLEAAGIRVIQIDEPAFREGLPLRKSDWADYLHWAVNAFRLASCGVSDETQIHTHMCYSEFNDIIDSIADMDADVITIETSRSQMELLDAFANFQYPNEIGPGVYDIHSPRIPKAHEMTALLRKALNVLPANRLWVNPDCGLKTRNWPETKAALTQMVAAAEDLRAQIS